MVISELLLFLIPVFVLAFAGYFALGAAVAGGVEYVFSHKDTTDWLCDDTALTTTLILVWPIVVVTILIALPCFAFRAAVCGVQVISKKKKDEVT